MRSVNVAPRPRPSLDAMSWPPCPRTRPAAIASPSPIPPNRCEMLPSACSKALKIRVRASASIPMPLSVQLKMKSAPSSALCRRIFPACAVNLTALRKTFQMTCCMRTASAFTCESAAPKSMSILSSFLSMSCLSMSTTCMTSAWTSTTANTRLSLPAEMELRSERSSMRRDSSATLRLIMGSKPANFAGTSANRSSNSAADMMAPRGVLSSCERTARNRVLAVSARSAASRAMVTRWITSAVAARSCTWRKTIPIRAWRKPKAPAFWPADQGTLFPRTTSSQLRKLRRG